MAYTLRRTGTPTSTIPFFPKSSPGQLFTKRTPSRGGLFLVPKRGLGDAAPGQSPDCMTVSDLVSACGGSGTQNCTGVGNQQCVAMGTALTDWAEDTVDSYFPCMPPGTSFTCPTLNAAAVTAADVANQALPTGAPVTNNPNASNQAWLTTQFYQNLFGGQSTAQAANNAYYAAPPSAASSSAPSSTSTSSSSAPPASTTAGASSAPAASSTNSMFSSPSGAASSTSWFDQSLLFGIPNWGLLAAAAGVAAIFFLGSKR
jgi:hypothetical protein